MSEPPFKPTTGQTTPKPLPKRTHNINKVLESIDKRRKMKTQPLPSPAKPKP